MSAPDSVDADSPWLGLASFTEETRALFFGREQEVAELERRVQRKLLTVLFGKSGLGKTSILQAGLVPGLRDRGYFAVYLRIDYGHDSPEPAEQIKQGINRAAGSGGGIQEAGAAGGAEREAAHKAATAGEWTQTGVTAPGESIWEFLHHRDDVLKDSSGATLTPLLVFDQFEELFTLAQSDEFGRGRAARFVEELADLVENRPREALEARLDTDESTAERFDFSRSDYRVVLALREDYLAPLESLKKLMPSLSQNRLRLAPMTGSQALEAVLQPGNRLRPGKPLVTQEVAEAIVRFVAGGAELANAEVEPSLLSLICRELNEQRIAQGKAEISQDLLAGSHETILSTFYERSLADQPAAVRRVIEDDLLTESGYRENLPPQLEDPETLRSGALALVNHAEAETQIGGPVTAVKNATDAIALLERLRRTDKSDPTTLVLGRAYAELGAVLGGQQDFGKADVAFQRASDLLRPVAERADASVDARRIYLSALDDLGVEKFNSDQLEAALGVARQALRIAKSLRSPGHGDADVAVEAHYALAQVLLATDLARLDRNEEAHHAADEALALLDQVLAQHPQYGLALLSKEYIGQVLSTTARAQLDPSGALRFANEAAEAALALASIEPGNAVYANQLGNSYAGISSSMWEAGRLRESIAYDRKAMATYGKNAAGFSYGLTNLAQSMSVVASEQARLGDFSGAAATLAAAKAFFSPSALRRLGPAAHAAQGSLSVWNADALVTIAYERGDFAAARRIAHTAIAALQVHGIDRQIAIGMLSSAEGEADYALGEFAAAEQADRTAQSAGAAFAKTGEMPLVVQRGKAQLAIWFSMALAREGKRHEAARTIAPAVQTYRALEKENHGDRWLPLEYAEALYAQALTDPPHRAALLREARGLVDHLIPAIARLHDTRAWRARIEAAEHAGRVATGQ